MMVSNYTQSLLSEQPVWINIEERLALKELESVCLDAEPAGNKCREENSCWRYFLCHHQQEESVCHIKRPHSEQKFFLCDEKVCQEESDQELEEDSCSLSSSFNDGECYDHQSQQYYRSIEDGLAFEKISHCSNLSDIEKPISLLSQMLQNQPNTQDKKPEHSSLKRCQSKYQCLNKWFASTS